MEYTNQFLPVGLVIFSGVANFVLGIYIYLFAYKLSNKNYLSAKYFSYICFSIFNWTTWIVLNNIYVYKLGNVFITYISNAMMYISLIIIIQSLVLFSISFPNNTRISKDYNFLRYPFIIILILIIIPGVGLLSLDNNTPSVLYHSIAYYILIGYILSYFILGIKILINKYRFYSKKKIKNNLSLILFSAIISVVFGFITNILIPFIYNDINFIYYGPVFTLFIFIAVIIGLLRYNLFNIHIQAVSILFTLIITLMLLIMRFSIIDNRILEQFQMSILFILMFSILYIFLTREVYIGFQKQILLDSKKKELELALDAKSNFLKNSSHQFRTPLTVILGYLGMIINKENSKYELNKTAIEDLKKTYISAKNLNNIINDVLTANDVNTVKFGVNIKDSVDFRNLIKSIIYEKQELLSNKSTKVNFKVKGKYSLALIDCAKIKEAINNIFDNAIFYGKGLIDINLDFSKKDFFEISIKDNGIGITAIDAKRIWKKFERGKRSPQINPNGSGLGLYLAKQILVQHGGDIVVYSDGLNKGSKFIITIPKNISIQSKNESSGVKIYSKV